jgi:FMN phosphatase YigB (HAD superfamily)
MTGARRNIALLVNLPAEIAVISADVFDTILLRTSRSERSRIMIGEQMFADQAASRGWPADPDLLVDTRLRVQQLAFRALARRGASGEVRLEDIIARQLCLMGLPASLLAERLRIEIEVEKRSLSLNRPLADVLRRHRLSGKRVVAVSDTTLSSPQVLDLIQFFHATDLVDHVHASADHGLTKRDGRLFDAVTRAENASPGAILHMGDDVHADVRVPLAKGIQVRHLPRESYRHWFRTIDGALTEARRRLRRKVRIARAAGFGRHHPSSFGRDVFGPIAAQFSMLIWLYAREAETDPKTVLLFCARGGIGIRETFERTLVKLGLPLGMRRENVMVSRLIAARSALLNRSDAAIEELDREFRGSTATQVATALGGRAYDLPKNWSEAFDALNFVKMLFGSEGAEVLGDVRRQNELFSRHLRRLMGDADRIILCDTGLYGSTQRLLAAGFPDIPMETIQFARSNYKGHSEAHFPRVTGLMVEQKFYSPLKVRSCVLRYWHIIESLYEPAVPSAKLFWENEQGDVMANCGVIDFGAIDPSVNNALLAGALSYVETLPENGCQKVLHDADVAWARLKKSIVRPTAADLTCLDVGARSVDFGRSDVVQTITERPVYSIRSSMASVKNQLWREGAITKQFPILKFILLPALEAALSLRGLLDRHR